MPAAAWRWPNFSPAEIACRGTGRLLLNDAALDKLQALRDRLGKPLIVRSAYRSPEHNRAVGGAKASKHLEGVAVDIAMANHDPEVLPPDSAVLVAPVASTLPAQNLRPPHAPSATLVSN